MIGCIRRALRSSLCAILRNKGLFTKGTPKAKDDKNTRNVIPGLAPTLTDSHWSTPTPNYSDSG